MNIKHTKGSWYAFADCVVTEEGKIAEVCTQNDLNRDSWRANTKLIAAAPDLLQSLYQAVTVFEQTKEMPISFLDLWYESAKEAIKKATE